jgi:hypothetical protein
MQPSLAWFGCDSVGLQKDTRVAAVKQPHDRNEVRLWFDRNHARANSAENPYSVAHVGADVERQITGLDKLPVERFHPATPPDWAVVGDEGTGDTGCAAYQVSLWHRQFRLSLGTFTTPSNTMGGRPRTARTWSQ